MLILQTAALTCTPPKKKKKLQHLLLIYEARTHQVDGVSACPIQVEHRCMLDTSTTYVRHAVLRVPFKKYYLSTWTYIGHNRI